MKCATRVHTNDLCDLYDLSPLPWSRSFKADLFPVLYDLALVARGGTRTVCMIYYIAHVSWVGSVLRTNDLYDVYDLSPLPWSRSFKADIFPILHDLAHAARVGRVQSAWSCTRFLGWIRTYMQILHNLSQRQVKNNRRWYRSWSIWSARGAQKMCLR